MPRENNVIHRTIQRLVSTIHIFDKIPFHKFTDSGLIHNLFEKIHPKSARYDSFWAAVGSQVYGQSDREHSGLATICYTRQISCNLFQRYPQNSSQRSCMCTQYAVHDQEPRRYLRMIDTCGSVACGYDWDLDNHHQLLDRRGTCFSSPRGLHHFHRHIVIFDRFFFPSTHHPLNFHIFFYNIPA